MTPAAIAVDIGDQTAASPAAQPPPAKRQATAGQGGAPQAAGVGGSQKAGVGGPPAASKRVRKQVAPQPSGPAIPGAPRSARAIGPHERARMKPSTHVARLRFGSTCATIENSRSACKTKIVPSKIPAWIGSQSDWRRITDAQIDTIPNPASRMLLYLNRINKYYAAAAALLTIYSPRALHRHLCPLGIERFHMTHEISVNPSIPIVYFDTSIGSAVVDFKQPLFHNDLFRLIYGITEFADNKIVLPATVSPKQIQQLKEEEYKTQARQYRIQKPLTIAYENAATVQIVLDQFQSIQNVMTELYVTRELKETPNFQVLVRAGEWPQLVNTPFYTLQRDNSITPNPDYVQSPKNIRKKLKAGWQLLNKSMIMLEKIYLARAEANTPAYKDDAAYSRIWNSMVPYQRDFITCCTQDIDLFYRSQPPEQRHTGQIINAHYKNFFEDTKSTPPQSIEYFEYLHVLMEYLVQYNRFMASVTKSMKRAAAAYAGI
jgi:hypothetical protein